MKEYFSKTVHQWKADYVFQTIASSAVSAFISLAYIIYNGILGIFYSSVWNGSIGVYYFLLAIVRTILICSRQIEHSCTSQSHRRRVNSATHMLLILLNVSLIIPIASMIRGDRTYHPGIIPAITMATYTTYRITMAIIHYRKAKRNDSMLIRELRTINLIDTLVSVLTLQNTMILVNEGEISGSMHTLSIISSSLIWGTVVALSVLFVRIPGKRTKKTGGAHSA